MDVLYLLFGLEASPVEDVLVCTESHPEVGLLVGQALDPLSCLLRAGHELRTHFLHGLLDEPVPRRLEGRLPLKLPDTRAVDAKGFGLLRAREPTALHVQQLEQHFVFHLTAIVLRSTMFFNISSGIRRVEGVSQISKVGRKMGGPSGGPNR
jgi:hypothetical protein